MDVSRDSDFTLTKSTILTRSVVVIELEASGVDVVGSVSSVLDPQISVITQPDVVIGEADGLEGVVARVEEISVCDERSFLSEDRQVASIGFRINVEAGIIAMMHVRAGSLRVSNRDAERTKLLCNGVQC